MKRLMDKVTHSVKKGHPIESSIYWTGMDRFVIEVDKWKGVCLKKVKFTSFRHAWTSWVRDYKGIVDAK